MPPSSPWPVSAFATSLPGDLTEVVPYLVALGFTQVDIVAEVERPAAHLEALADSGLLVGCAALGRNLPAGHALDAADVGVRRATLELMRRQVADAARLGATTAYLVPSFEGGAALACFAEGCCLLAEFAAARGVRLCVEHVPGRALPTAAAALDWMQRVGDDRLALLLDVGHCLISGEDAAAVVWGAGGRLGHVHLDDNDGVRDLHWPLLTGRLTVAQLAGVMTALRTIDYRGALALELNPENAVPAAALRDGKALVESILSSSAAHPEG